MKKIAIIMLLAMGLNAAQFNWIHTYKEASAKALKEMLKEFGSFEDGGYSVAIKSADRTTVDPKILREKYPTIAAEVSKSSSVTSVSVKKI